MKAGSYHTMITLAGIQVAYLAQLQIEALIHGELKADMKRGRGEIFKLQVHMINSVLKLKKIQ